MGLGFFGLGSFPRTGLDLDFETWRLRVSKVGNSSNISSGEYTQGGGGGVDYSRVRYICIMVKDLRYLGQVYIFKGRSV